MKKNEFIAFDFDGVIAHYYGFKGEHHEEKPIQAVVDAIRMLHKEGCKVIINSTRPDDFLKEYCEKYDIPVDYFNENPNIENSSGKPVAQVYVDDKTVLYKGQSAEELFNQALYFKSYWDNDKDSQPES